MSEAYKQIDERLLEERVYELIRSTGSRLRDDVFVAMKSALKRERNERAKGILKLIVENAEMATELDVPLCQDTGTAWILLEIGSDTRLVGDLQAAANRGVARAYKEAGLRMSLVHDALLDRRNTGDNTPAFLDIVQSEDGATRLSVMLKGAGSDNASRLLMLSPDESWEGVKREVLALVHEKAAMACPPLVISLGIGTTFDKVGSLSKRALLRDISQPHPNPEIAQKEAELLELVNQTGFGPAGLGGDTSALAVIILTAPCHIAALPLSINMMCSALRSKTITLF